MKKIKRTLGLQIRELALKNNKMAFISGPRQVGKTFEANEIARDAYHDYDYLNWDNIEFRKLWQMTPTKIVKKSCTIFDEIHKARNWKTTLKGIFDHNDKKRAIIVTGSTRVETFRRGGDSMMGRYFHFRLHPLTLGELSRPVIPSPEEFLVGVTNLSPNRSPALLEKFDHLLHFGGFPEPYLKGDIRFLRLWQRGRLEKLIRIDLRDLSRIPELGQLEVLCALLPDRIGSPLSIQTLCEDMEVSNNTIRNWLKYLHALYFLYEVKPFSKKIPRAIKKEGKVYLWDYSTISNEGARLENMIANHLLKAVHYWSDLGYGDYSLSYFRDKAKREVDFVIIKDGVPWAMFEVKASGDHYSPHLDYFRSKWKSIALSVVLTKDHSIFRNLGEGRYVISMENLLALLP